MEGIRYRIICGLKEWEDLIRATPNMSIANKLILANRNKLKPLGVSELHGSNAFVFSKSERVSVKSNKITLVAVAPSVRLGTANKDGVKMHKRLLIDKSLHYRSRIGISNRNRVKPLQALSDFFSDTICFELFEGRISEGGSIAYNLCCISMSAKEFERISNVRAKLKAVKNLVASHDQYVTFGVELSFVCYAEHVIATEHN